MSSCLELEGNAEDGVVNAKMLEQVFKGLLLEGRPRPLNGESQQRPHCVTDGCRRGDDTESKGSACNQHFL